MKVVINKLASLLLLVGMISACSVENGTVADAGIGGSGYVATGTITGFGSVFVNGVEFETTATSFDVDDAMASQAALRIGMVVRVNGSVNADGITGTATRIVYDNELEGRIDSIVTNADLTSKTLSILGSTVIVDSGDTLFEGTAFGSLVVGNVVEISGHHTASNQIQATLVEFKSAVADQFTVVEIKGVISQLSGTTFKLSTLNVNAASANLTDLPGGLADGAYVEVKGAFNGTDTITAVEVEGEEYELGDDGDSASIEGYITRYVSIADFDIDGHRVDASSAVLEPSNINLSIGDKVEGEGSLNKGVLQATEVKVRAGSTEIAAYVAAVDLFNKAFTLRVVSSQPVITIKMNTATRTEDDTGSNDALTDLSPGDFVEVGGFESAVATVTASRVKRKTPEKIMLQGVVTVQNLNVSITILGVDFPVDIDTEYEDDSDNSYAGHAGLIADAINNQSIIKIEDDNANGLGIADKVELEQQ